MLCKLNTICCITHFTWICMLQYISSYTNIQFYALYVIMQQTQALKESIMSLVLSSLLDNYSINSINMHLKLKKTFGWKISSMIAGFLSQQLQINIFFLGLGVKYNMQRILFISVFPGKYIFLSVSSFELCLVLSNRAYV